MTMPSERFLLEQAIINAANLDNPLTIINGARVAGWLRYLTEGGTRLPGFFEYSVCREYRKLSERFEDGEASYCK